MSDKQLYVSCWYPCEEAVEENGARRIAYSFYAANEKQAHAKATLYFMEQFPDADDTDFEMRIYSDAVGVPRPALEVWDEDFLYENDWNEKLGYPKPKSQSNFVDLGKLSSTIRVAALVASGLEFEESPPTFHEIRSLAGRLYEKERGRDFA